MSWSSHDAPGGRGAGFGPGYRRVRALLLLGGVAFTLPATAAVKYSLAAEAGVQALSNPFLLAGNDRSALLGEAVVSPGVTLTGSEGTSLDVTGTAIARAYHRRYGRFLLGSARATGVVRRSEQLTINAFASFQRDLSADALTEGIDAVSEPDSVRNTVAATASLAWTPSARDTITPRLSFERSTFDRSVLLRQTRTITGDVVYARRLSDRTSLGVGTRAATSRSGDAEFDTLAVFATLDQVLSPRLRLTAEAGAERTHDRSRGSVGAGGSDRVSFTGRGQLCHTGQSRTACLNAAIVSDVSALGFLQRQYSAGASVTQTIGPRLSAGLAADYTRSQRQQGISGTAQSAASVRATLDWRFSPSLALGGEAGYRQRDVGSGSNLGGGYVGLRLRWQQ